MELQPYFDTLARAAALEPEARHAAFLSLHRLVCQHYQAALRGFSEAQALSPAPGSADTRSVLQVVGHIAEWERFAILGAGDLLAGLPHPRMAVDLDGYREADGTSRDFASIQEFNDLQRARHAGWPWERMRAYALETSSTLLALFSDPALVHAGRLEASLPIPRRRLPGGHVLEGLRMGWGVWITVIEHEGLEHAAELGIELGSPPERTPGCANRPHPPDPLPNKSIGKGEKNKNFHRDHAAKNSRMISSDG